MLRVSTPDRQARDKDREAAIKLVRAASSNGQIIEADRDKRIEELRHAQTLAEIDGYTRDLQPAVAVDYGPPMVPDAPVPARATSGGLPKALFLIPLLVILVVVGGVVAAVVSLSGGVSSVTVGDAVVASSRAAEADVLSAQGYDDLVAAVSEQSGSTTVFDAVLYPSYAVVSVPADASSNREESFYWDGTDLRSNDLKSTASSRRFDLTHVDASVIVSLVDRVRGLVEDPTTWYAVIRAPDADRSMIWAYATNEYGETAYLGATRDGTVVYDSTQH